MKLSEVFGLLKISPSDFTDREIASISCSTDKITENSLFFAIRGEKHDGHEYISLAAKRGAAAAAGDRDAVVPKGFTYIKTDNAERAYALCCSYFYGRPDERLITVGVTGTNGKTTVTNMLRTIVLSGGLGCGLIGTVESIAAGKSRPAERTTPPPEELFALLKEMVSAGERFCVMEVSSHALARNRVSPILFDVGVMTNVTQDHLDFHKTMRAYAETKASLMAQSKVGVINADDARAELFKSRAKRFVTYGIDNRADFQAKDISYSDSGLSFSSPVGKIKLPAGGKFSVYNALAAIAAASASGIKDEQIRTGLNLFKGVRGRMERLDVRGKYKVYIDYAHTPDGLSSVLGAIRSFAPKRIITVFGCGGDRDREKRPLMGEIAGRLSDFSVVTSDNPRTEDPGAIIAEVVSGFGCNRFVAVIDRREAIRFALRMAEEGDIVLLAGKGHETYQIVGDKAVHMDERELVREIEEEGL